MSVSGHIETTTGDAMFSAGSASLVTGHDIINITDAAQLIGCIFGGDQELPGTVPTADHGYSVPRSR